MNEDDDQRASDLERILDEGDLARAMKTAKKWSTSNAHVALGEVQRRNDSHRREVAADESMAQDGVIDLERFKRRDEELVSLREMLG